MGLGEISQRKREALIESGWLISEFARAFEDGTLSRMVENRRDECVVYAGMEIKPPLARWPSDFMNGIYLAYANMCTIVPTISKVRNWGFDGTGIYCASITDASGNNSQDYDYSSQAIDDSQAFSLKVDERFSSETENGKLLDRFLFVPGKLKFTARCGEMFFRIAGIRGIRWFGTLYRKVRNLIRP